MTKSKQTAKPEKPKHVYKSAKTGEFVSEEFAKKHPATTVKQTIHKTT